MKLKNKAALVTGASTGIGRAIALAVASEGGRVALIGRDENGLDETSRLVKGVGGDAHTFIADLRDINAIDRLVGNVSANMGTIDIIVNCAGVWHDRSRAYYGVPLWEMSTDELDDVLDVGIRAPMLLCRAFIPAMVRRRQGKIVNISGTFGSGGAKWLHYYVSKKALEDFTVGLADELRPHEVQANCISPADVRTPALQRFFPDDYQTALQPNDVANLAVFLMTGEADHITGSCTVIRNKGVH